MIQAPERQTAVSAVALGHPSYVWRSGQDRRLALIRRYAPLEGRVILDIGCGIGTYVRKLGEFSHRAYGVDIDAARVHRGVDYSLSSGQPVPALAVAASEHLPFASDSFHVVILNEVIEHVRDEVATLREACRVLRPGGRMVIFAPNRLFPFETHGVYLGRRYVFGNIPLVNYLPDLLRRRLVPHARAYLKRDLHRLTKGLGARVIVDSYVYPGFDNIASRSRTAAKLLRGLLYRLEATPLSAFGLSHFLVLEKTV